uniref:Transmembrane protein n=1 Tax=Lotus japonicus TaxID=34305 RepID=I3SLD8_LOTJA|nr:unknown [Lotus japonicus]
MSSHFSTHNLPSFPSSKHFPFPSNSSSFPFYHHFSKSSLEYPQAFQISLITSKLHDIDVEDDAEVEQVAGVLYLLRLFNQHPFFCFSLTCAMFIWLLVKRRFRLQMRSRREWKLSNRYWDSWKMER